jgi:Predicted signal transduction protein with a C-terminal ATPase domain
MLDAVDESTKFEVTYGKIIRKESEYQGVILLSVTEDLLSFVYSDSYGTDTEFYILDENGKAISHSYSTLIGVNLYYMPAFFEEYSENNSLIVKRNSSTVLLTNYHDSESGWTIVEERKLNNLLYGDNILFSVVTLFILVVIFAVIISLFLARSICSPIAGIVNDIRESGRNGFSPINESREFAELGEVSVNYNAVVGKVRDLLSEVQKEAKAKRVNELSFLQAQINPHFLHNTLFNVRCLLDMGRIERADRMLQCLIPL